MAVALGPPPFSLPSLFRDLPQRAAALTGSGPAWHSVELTPGQGLGGLGLGAEEMQEAPKEGSLEEGPSLEAVARQPEGTRLGNCEEQTTTVMKLEIFKTGDVLEGKKEEGWRQEPLLRQSHRTQVLFGNVGKTESSQRWHH